jgi:hypothetical protein
LFSGSISFLASLGDGPSRNYVALDWKMIIRSRQNGES